VEDSEKLGEAVAVGAVVAFVESVVPRGVANENVEVVDLLSVAEGFSSDFASVRGEGAGVNVMVGMVSGLARSSGAVTLVGISLRFGGGVWAFFCSSIFARILASASASRSCFSHFEKPRKPGRVGLPVTLESIGVTTIPDEATRRPSVGCDCDCWNGLMRIAVLPVMD
jgi:hypothetical protein